MFKKIKKVWYVYLYVFVSLCVLVWLEERFAFSFLFKIKEKSLIFNFLFSDMKDRFSKMSGNLCFYLISLHFCPEDRFIRFVIIDNAAFFWSYKSVFSHIVALRCGVQRVVNWHFKCELLCGIAFVFCVL